MRTMWLLAPPATARATKAWARESVNWILNLIIYGLISEK